MFDAVFLQAGYDRVDYGTKLLCSIMCIDYPFNDLYKCL